MPKNIGLPLLGCVLLTFCLTAQAQALKGLWLTTQGIYHDYDSQTQVLTEALARQMNIRFDVSLAELDRWKTTDFGAGYDLVIYNICLADNQDSELIANMRRQTETLGIPTIVLHCTMHSFRETDNWWPLYGLKTVAHDPLGPMLPAQVVKHPVLNGIPEDWQLASDELYVNLVFEAKPLLSAPGEDGKTHVAAWLASPGGTRLFGTTLGHSDETIADTIFQRLVANAVLYVTDNLTAAGEPAPGLGPVPGAAVETLSAPEGVNFLSKEDRRCVYRKLAMSAGPCYLGCALHPFKWGAAASSCRQDCSLKLPSHETAIAACTQP